MKFITLFSLLSMLTLSLTAAPNVIVVLTDDLGYGDIYCLHQHKRDNGDGTGGIANDGLINGDEEAFIYTPYIDRMAAEGAKLTRHYTSAPVCAPARGSLLQGRDQGHANIRNNSFDKNIADNHTLGTVMQQTGYYTATVGKWGVGGTSTSGAGLPNKRGFDYFYGYIRHTHGHQHYPGNGGTVYEGSGIGTTPSAITSGLDHAYTTDLWTAKTKQIIQDRHSHNTDNPESAKPFFIYLAYDAPHAQLQVPTQAYPSGLGTSGGLTWPLNTNSGTNDSWIHPDYSTLSNSAGRHATMVRRIDTAMGDILQTLRDLEIDDETLVVFTSDNGTHNESGSGGSVSHDPRNFDSYGELEGIKRDHWEGGIRMPTFAWWPTQIGDNNAATAGLDSTRPSAFWDWMPTIVDAAGLTPPAWTNGVSLLPELTETGAQADKGYYYFEYSFGGSTPNYAEFTNHGGETRGQMQTIFMDGTDGKRYKGIRTGIASHSDDFQIYDIDADASEGTNLASGMTDLQQKMKDKVLQVRIDGDYTRSYLSSENTPAVTPASTVNGLDYKSFTGQWDWVPETHNLSPTATGTSDNLDLSKRSQDDNIALEFTGYISIPTDGTYTFQMTTDSTVATNTSGGMLWIHDAHIIDDDYNHDGSAQNGSMRLKAGLHPLRVLYKHSTGSHDIALQYSGPGIELQTIADSSYFRDGVAPPEPIANPDSASTLATTLVSIPVLANDTDDGSPSALSIQSVTSPSFGSAVINGSNIDYTAESGKYGLDSFSYTISDGQFTATAEVTVNVTVDSTDLWIPLNETTGTSVSEAGGNLLGSHVSSPIHIAGNHGYALSFDGSDDQVDLTNISLPTGTSSRTISAWVRVSATSGVENQAILSYGENSNGARFTFRLDGSSTQRLRLEVQGGFIVGSTQINDGAWHHVAATLTNDGSPDVNEAKLYVDGSLETVSSSGSEAINTSSAGTPTIGGSNHSGSFNFKGDIDEVRISNSALNGAEIQGLFTANKQTSSEWLYRHFGDSPPSWTDDSDNDNISLLAESAFGLNPHSVDSPIDLISSAMLNQELQLTFTRRGDSTHDFSYIVEASNNLTTWDISTSELESVTHPTLGSPFELVTAKSTLDTNASDRQFIRVRIEP